ncbi:hypothetical protein ACHAW5_004374 [Stephanodiscus triporus]|uniref:RanBP2-type domain-containing protein n=1 Tax=Stephanodiscus triporus TaxID=2934178 RepID=A0ABD3Q473_9STRA
MDNSEMCANSDVDNTWQCRVCGKINLEKNGKMQRLCIICGKQKGYLGSKRIRILSQCRVDTTPHLTSATKDELRKAGRIEKSRLPSEVPGNNLLFLSTKTDHEAIARMSIKDEVNSVIASIRNSLEAKSNATDAATADDSASYKD